MAVVDGAQNVVEGVADAALAASKAARATDFGFISVLLPDAGNTDPVGRTEGRGLCAFAAGCS